jgi:hypothetical protein
MEELEGQIYTFTGKDEISVGDGDVILIINECANTLYIGGSKYAEGFPLYEDEAIVLNFAKGSVIKLHGDAEDTDCEFRSLVLPSNGDISFYG